MYAKIIRGRIRVVFDEPDLDDVDDLKDQVFVDIGSAREVDKHPREVSCALSIENFRKLKKLGCKLSQDATTRTVIERLSANLKLYDEECERGRRVKEEGWRPYNPDSYKFRVTPFAHQADGFQFLHSMKTPALFGSCGSGKTYIVVTWADSMLKAGCDMVFLVVCPVNLIKHVWQDDAARFSDLTVTSLREPTVPTILAEDWDDKGDPKDLSISERAALRARRLGEHDWKVTAKRRARTRHTKRLNARFAADTDMYVLNPENLRNEAKEKRVRELCKRKKNEGKEICLIIDESSRLKSRTSRTYKALKRIRAFCSQCIIMTGTPAPNGILDLWAQFDVLDGGQTLQPNFVDYRHDTCHEIVLRGRTYQDKAGNTHNLTIWKPKRGKPIEVYKTIKPRMIRFRTEDCIDLPPMRFLIRDISMTKEQSEVYDDMEQMLFTELEGEPVTAKVAATKLMKLREITGGFLITDQSNAKPINKDTPKMLELDELLEQSIAIRLGDDGPPCKALIWAQYQWECKTLVQRYKKYGARGLFGGISSGKKDAAIDAFKHNDKCRVLVCHPKSAGHGLTLVEANYAFYYSLSYDFEEFYQSFWRMPRPGQTRHMTYYFLVTTGTIDEELIDAIRSKKNLSDLITDGRFGRDEFLAGRGKDRATQIDLNWEIPTDLPATSEHEVAGSHNASFDW